jgi:3-oxoacyl-[acyl-carrier-protein] synthase I
VPSEFFDRRRDRIGLCRAVGIPSGVYGFARMLALSAPALAEACAGVALPEPPPVVLALPEAGRPDDDARLTTDLIPAIAAKSGVEIDVRRSRIVRAGHAGFAIALTLCEAMLASSPEGSMVLVGGVDSYWHPNVAAWLDEEHRLHGLEAEEGFIPSEGAAFARVAARGRALSPLAVVTEIRTGKEERVGEEEPVTAGTMTRMLRSIVEAPGRDPAGWVLSDVNGERHRLKEWERVASRGLLADRAVHQRLPDVMGDLGAATGSMMVALACAWWRAGCAPLPTALGVLHADSGERGAFLLEEAPWTT